MTSEQILVIEDNLEVAHQIVALCFKLGYEPLLARDGFTGVLLAMKTRPRVIISDVETPGLDGFEIVRRVRKHHELDHTAIVAVSKIVPGKPAANQIPFDAVILKTRIASMLPDVVARCFSIDLHEQMMAHAV